MKWLKAMKLHWVLLILISIQLVIWIFPLLLIVNEEVGGSKLMSMETETPPENLIRSLSKRTPPTSKQQRETAYHEQVSEPPIMETVTVSSENIKPAPNTNQPTLLIYADWFLINWQALLSILTILPFVVLRWKNLLMGRPIETAQPE